jgi:hypothetical protein
MFYGHSLLNPYACSPMAWPPASVCGPITIRPSLDPLPAGPPCAGCSSSHHDGTKVASAWWRTGRGGTSQYASSALRTHPQQHPDPLNLMLITLPRRSSPGSSVPFTQHSIYAGSNSTSGRLRAHVSLVAWVAWNGWYNSCCRMNAQAHSKHACTRTQPPCCIARGLQ